MVGVRTRQHGEDRVAPGLPERRRQGDRAVSVQARCNRTRLMASVDAMKRHGLAQRKRLRCVEVSQSLESFEVNTQRTACQQRCQRIAG